MMIDTHFHLSEDDFKNILSKYLDFDVDNSVAFINKNDNGENILNVSSKPIRMQFNCEKIREILIDLFNDDTIKIDNITVHIINNTTRNRKYVSIDCDMSKECIKSITDMISVD